jgi:invasion protein IalB
MRIGSMKKIGTHLATWIAGAALIALFEAAAAAQQPAQPAPRPAPAKPQAPQTTQAQPTPAPTAQRAPAQPAPSVQGTQSSEPQRTTATYEDWIVQCQTQTGPPSRKLCEMTQITQVEAQGKSQPVSRVILPRPAKDQPSTLVVQVPVNVTFSINVRVQSSDGDQGLVAPFARCVPDGCFADFEIKDEALKKFRSASATGKLSFADAGGRGLSVPLSFKGFGNAYDALMKE